ncbi:RAD55 family ATPase [archaeon]
MTHVKTGIKEFNEIVPGLPNASAVLVQGTPGAGKTIFSLSLMNTTEKGKKIVVLTNNTQEEIGAEMTSFKLGFEAFFIDCYSWLSGAPAAVDSLANLSKITFLIEDALEPGSILLFDSLTPLLLYSSDDEIQRFLQQVIAIVKAKSSVIMFTLDLGTYPSDAENTFRSLCDSVVNLDSEKGLRIVKMRDTKVPAKDFFYELGPKGFRLRTK